MDLILTNCIVSGYDILTLRDKEEGYTGKRGFATAEILDVDCSGLTPINPHFDKLSDDSEESFEDSKYYIPIIWVLAHM